MRRAGAGCGTQSPAHPRRAARHLPADGVVLEVASGSGEHIVHFAEALPALEFQPSDPSDRARASIDDWVRTLGLANVRPALALDAEQNSWPVARADAVLCSNMVHIAHWQATVGLLAGAGRLLPAGGLLYLYGPYRRSGHHTAPSNAAFDRDLRERNPAWGVRDLEEVASLAGESGFGRAGDRGDAGQQPLASLPAGRLRSSAVAFRGWMR